MSAGDLIHLDDVRDIPDMTITEADVYGPNGEILEPSSWERVDLTDDRYGIPPDPPAIMGLLYTGKRHVVSGPPESTKTLIAYLLLVQAIRDGLTVAIVDFEMGPTAARRMLEDVGATLDEIRSIYYVEPDDPPADEYAALLRHCVQLVLIDAAAGAYDATGLDDNARKDAEQFARAWIRPLWQNGVTTLLVDHVTKDAAARGKFTIGSERKVGQADVHISCDALKPLSRGHSGVVKITVHKDRPGFLQRPTAAVFELHSDPDTHAITYAVREHEAEDDTSWKPTILMERVSRYLEQHVEPVSRTQIETNVKGKSAKHIRQAIDFLIDDGFAAEIPGPRNARNVFSAKPYRQPEAVTSAPDSDEPAPRPPHGYANQEDGNGVTNSENPEMTPSHPVPPRPDGVTTTPSDGVPLTGRRTGSDTQEAHDPVQDPDGVIDVHDPAVQALLDDIPF